MRTLKMTDTDETAVYDAGQAGDAGRAVSKVVAEQMSTTLRLGAAAFQKLV
jgi:hypothetical protein